MKKTILLTLLASMLHVTMAAETVEINKVKYTKYSDAEIRNYMAKVNSVRPDMTSTQVAALLGKPVREQVVSDSPPQRIVVFPLSVVVSFYFNRASRTWLVTTPTLYGSPLCQREDGLPLKNSLGTEIIDYPSITCIPQRFATNASSKPKSPPMAARFSAAKWQLIDKGRGGREGSNELYLDTNSIKTIGPRTAEVAILRSFDSSHNDDGPTYQSEAIQLVISCDDDMWGAMGRQRFSYEMARGSVTYTWNSDKSPELSKIPFADSYPAITAKAVCSKL
jgi:hypothetical protein